MYKDALDEEQESAEQPGPGDVPEKGVLLEAEEKDERNRSREAVVPQDAIEAMLGKMTVPEAHEARKVEWICL